MAKRTIRALHTVRMFFPKVKHVVDATEGVEVEVSAQDSRTSRKKDHNECALAVACKHKFKLDGVIISRTVAYLVKGTRARRFYMPGSASREIVSFDRGAGFAAGTYKLSKPYTNHKLGVGHGQGGGRGIATGNLKKRFRHMTTGIRSVLGGEKAGDE